MSALRPYRYSRVGKRVDANLSFSAGVPLAPARVLESSYHWRRLPPFIGLPRRTGLGGSSEIQSSFGQNKWAQRREAENEYEVGETMSDETYLLQRIMGLETELSYFAESSRQQQFRHNTEISRLQNDNRKLQARLGVLQAENNTLRQNENRQLQARLGVLQAENNTLRVQLEAALSVISYLEQRLKFHLQSLLEQEATAGTTDRLSNAA
jgi:hypothetical protein